MLFYEADLALLFFVGKQFSYGHMKHCSLSNSSMIVILNALQVLLLLQE
jgi:hypothetical protein